jgi:hypothetical protein
VWEAHLRPGAFLLKCPKDPALPENIDLPRDPLNAIAFSPDGARLLAQNTAGKLYAWDRATGYPLDETEPLPADATAEATTPDGKYRLFVLGGQAYYAETARWQQHLKDEAARWQEQSRPRPDWHRDQAAKAEQAGQWFAAAFHRRQLARLSADAGDGIAALEQAKLADAFRIKHEVTAARTAKKPAAPKP